VSLGLGSDTGDCWLTQTQATNNKLTDTTSKQTQFDLDHSLREHGHIP